MQRDPEANAKYSALEHPNVETVAVCWVTAVPPAVLQVYVDSMLRRRELDEVQPGEPWLCELIW